MAPSRKTSNGRSPLVNKQHQITAFFSKTSLPQKPQLSPPNPSPLSKLPNPKPNPSPNASSSPNSSPPTTPSPLNTKSKPKSANPNPKPNHKPLLVVGSQPSNSPSLGEQVVNRRIRVYWPLDKTWYEGSVKSFDKASGKHLVEYDDADEELLDLSKEKIEWVEGSVRKFRRLRKVSVVVDEDEGGNEGNVGVADGNSSDEDWDKNGVIEEEEEEADGGECLEDMELEDEEKEEKRSSKRKRTDIGGGAKKLKDDRGVQEVSVNKKKKSGFVFGDLSSKPGKPLTNGQEGNPANNVDNVVRSDALERFGDREERKLPFLGKDRRDINRRLLSDPNYDPKTLYLPPQFLKSLTGGQRQWWEFKSKNMDKVLFFKMGKFYELFEMDAHVGVKELNLQYMKGEQPHCGFPEKNFSVNVEKLARKGYRVLVVEQTETPEQMEIRRREEGLKDKVVKREICSVVTKGTLTEGEMLSANPDASYILSVNEGCSVSSDDRQQRVYGVCVIDVATSRIIIGQIKDDMDCSALCCLLSELRPVEIIKPANVLSLETEKALTRYTRDPLVNELVPHVEYWDADRTVCEVKSFYSRINELSVSLPEKASIAATDTTVKEQSCCLPDVLKELLSAGNDGSFALSALGGALFYLRQAFLDETLLRYAKYESLPCAGFGDVFQKPYMVLDSAALENLEIFENSRTGGSKGTLYSQLNHCATAFGKRLLKAWLARPLYHAKSIRERQDAIAGLRGNNLSATLEFRKELNRLPDMERLLTRLFAISGAHGRNANKIVLYEDAAKKQLQEFISALRGCEIMILACSSLGSILDDTDSVLLHHLLIPGQGLPDVSPILEQFRDAFDWVEANSTGRIIPHEGVDTEYDAACKEIEEVESNLKKHLKEQRKLLSNTSIAFVTVGKDTYLLEVPESLRGSIPKDYELRSSKKGFFRYWTPYIKKMVAQLSQAESEKESRLKNILQSLIGRFCEHHTKWRQLVSTVAELDVLTSLVIASDYYEGPTCRPTISIESNPNEVPHLTAKSLGHPILGNDLSKGTFVPNDINIGGSDHATFILLTGPNMGGKSTLLRQVCLAVILAQIGSDVPAEHFELSLVDQIFVRMGAKDHIMAGQSTFLTEIAETASMLASATRNSLVALDELGRGTSTSDGQAIAESVLEHFVRKVQCRGMFSTHYHRLSIDYRHDPKVSLCHMACQVGKGDGGVEEVTFLYRLTPGACPKSYGVNVAKLAGIPDSVLLKAAAKSREFEAVYGGRREASTNCTIAWEEEVVRFMQDLAGVVAETSSQTMVSNTSITSLCELQHKARILLKQC